MTQIPIPPETAIAAQSLLADVRAVTTALTAFSTVSALGRAEEIAAKAVIDLRGLRMQIRGIRAEAQRAERAARKVESIEDYNGRVREARGL